MHIARSRRPGALLLPLLFPLLHLTWGAGFLWGLARISASSLPPADARPTGRAGDLARHGADR
jgi:hypothetical protein